VDDFLTKDSLSGNLDSLHFDPIVDEKIILTCSKEYYRSRVKNNLSFESLSHQDFISYTDEATIIKGWFKNHFKKSPAKIRKILTVDDHNTIVSAVMHNLGIAVVASHLVKEELQSGDMIAIKTEKTDIVNTISLVQLMNKRPTLAEKTFSRFLIHEVQKMVSEKR
jgi:DNA-binding transcriptional LysR family regulator